MPSQADIDDFLAQKHLAVVGVSTDPRNFTHVVYRALKDHGRTMYPVNRTARADYIDGDRAYRTLADVPDPVDGVVVMVRARLAADAVREAAARGVPRVWLFHGIGPGAVSREAIELCHEHNMRVVDGACPFMFEAPVTGIHKLHQRLSGRRILQPSRHARHAQRPQHARHAHHAPGASTGHAA